MQTLIWIFHNSQCFDTKAAQEIANDLAKKQSMEV